MLHDYWNLVYFLYVSLVVYLTRLTSFQMSPLWQENKFLVEWFETKFDDLEVHPVVVVEAFILEM